MLDLIFPRRWGYHVDGEWTPYSVLIASVAAMTGSVGIMYRMSKLQRSFLDIEFYSTRFRPKEIVGYLAALEQVRPLFSKVIPTESSVTLYADLVLSRVESVVVSSASRKELIELTKNEGNSPRNVILSLVVQESQSLLETGEFHYGFGRGALNDDGHRIKATFDIALDELVKSGLIDNAGAKKKRAEVANAIASFG
jgi:hypothetical protein